MGSGHEGTENSREAFRKNKEQPEPSDRSLKNKTQSKCGGNLRRTFPSCKQCSLGRTMGLQTVGVRELGSPASGVPSTHHQGASTAPSPGSGGVTPRSAAPCPPSPRHCHNSSPGREPASRSTRMKGMNHTNSLSMCLGDSPLLASPLSRKSVAAASGSSQRCPMSPPSPWTSSQTTAKPFARPDRPSLPLCRAVQRSMSYT